MKVKAALMKVNLQGEIPSRIERAHPQGVPNRDFFFSRKGERERVDGTNPERTRWDPKDGDLCLARSKPGETLVEDRSDYDVQIDRRSWV
jgi:hypothetical protein